LTMSPVELVRAFAPFISDGSLPAIRWVDAVRSQDGEWERYGETPAPARILDPASSTEIRESLVRDDAIAYQAQAISGEPLGWFMGGIWGLTGRYAVVVVLEGEGSPAAAEIGVEMLANVNVASIP
jgi:hypothetical protein